MKTKKNAMTKFETMIDQELFEALTQYASKNNRDISSVVNDAIAAFLAHSQTRPIFRDSMEQVLTEHEELLSRLAK